MPPYLWRKRCAVATDTSIGLLEQIRNDDHRAFEQLFDAHWPQLYRYAHKALRDAADAEDLTQELFCEVWAGRAQLHVRGSVAAYLMGALRHKILTRFRESDIRSRHAQHLGATQPASVDTTLPNLIRHDTLTALHERAQQLPPREREVFLLGMLEELSVKEIAERFATSEQTVRNQLNSALHKLTPFLSRLLS